MEFLIICPLVFLAGFVDSIAGGGGLISLPAYMISGLPVINSIATNKMSSFMGTSLSTYKYARKGFISLKLSLIAVPCALIGSTIGANLALLMDDTIFKYVMLAVIPLTAVYVLTHKEFTPANIHLSFAKTALISAAVALVIGIYDGFYGPGTGTFLILLLTGLAGFSIQNANGLTKAINLSTNIAALTVYLVNGQVVIRLGIIAGIFNILGNYLGSSKFSKGGSNVARPVIIFVLVIFFIKVITDLV